MKIKIYRDILQRTDAWLVIKKAKTSGSGIKPILSAKSKGPWETYAFELIAQSENKEPLRYDQGFLSKAVQWGVDMEPHAVKAFEKKMNLIVEEVGWIESLDPKLVGKSGCSPDGIIDIYEWIEVKCLDTKKHIQYIAKNKLPTEFKPQIINYFVINPDLKKVYFILYDPRVKTESKRLHIMEILREDVQKDIDKLYDGLIEFHDLKDKLYVDYLNTD